MTHKRHLHRPKRAEYASSLKWVKENIAPQSVFDNLRPEGQSTSDNPETNKSLVEQNQPTLREREQ